MAVVAGMFLFWLVSYLVKLRKRGAVTGAESIIGGTGEAMESFVGEGKIWLEGESWAAHSEVPIEKGQDVVVQNMTGLVLQVAPAQETEPAELQHQ
jgi:membrane-bound serine protease (ClpP class)